MLNEANRLKWAIRANQEKALCHLSAVPRPTFMFYCQVEIPCLARDCSCSQINPVTGLASWPIRIKGRYEYKNSSPLGGHTVHL